MPNAPTFENPRRTNYDGCQGNGTIQYRTVQYRITQHEEKPRACRLRAISSFIMNLTWFSLQNTIYNPHLAVLHTLRDGHDLDIVGLNLSMGRTKSVKIANYPSDLMNSTSPRHNTEPLYLVTPSQMISEKLNTIEKEFIKLT